MRKGLTDAIQDRTGIFVDVLEIGVGSHRPQDVLIPLQPDLGDRKITQPMLAGEFVDALVAVHKPGVFFGSIVTS